MQFADPAIHGERIQGWWIEGRGEDLQLRDLAGKLPIHPVPHPKQPPVTATNRINLGGLQKKHGVKHSARNLSHRASVK
jgi:hypothetical protein